MTQEVERKMMTTVIGRLSRPKWRRAVAGTSVIVAMLITGTGLIPPILINTTWRNRLLESAVAQPGWTVTAEMATGGWLTPLEFHSVHIADDESLLTCEIHRLRTSKGLLGFLWGGDDLGKITLVEPMLAVSVPEDGRSPTLVSNKKNTLLEYEVIDGGLTLNVSRRSDPIVDVDGLDLQGRVALDEDGQRTLYADAAQIFDHAQLADALTRQNLALVAPVLSQSTRITGTASVWLDAFEVPLDGAEIPSIPLHGRARFHTLNAQLRRDWVQQLALFTGAMAGAQVPGKIEIVQDSDIEFVVGKDGIEHQGMAFLLPELARDLQVTSSGTIGLDERLDLMLEISLPKVTSAGGPLLSMLAAFSAQPLQLAVKGTVSEPQLQMPAGTDLLGEITRRVSPAQYQPTAPNVTSAILEVMQNGKNNPQGSGEKITGDVLNLIRAVRDQSNSRAADAEASGADEKRSAREKRRQRNRRSDNR
jgi:hypothetical protein